MKVEDFLQLVVQSQNTLVSPRKWDDPFENILSRVACRKPNGDLHKYALRDRVYGQCWTLVEESDATWRIYVPNGNGVRLKTTIRNLHQRFYKSFNSYGSISCFIGRVDYLSEDKLLALFSDPKWNKENLFCGNSQGQAKSLLFKREAFRHEQEIRLIYLDPHNIGVNDFYSYQINLSEFIEQITFDPRMEKKVYNTYLSIVNKYGYSGDIGKSTLYDLPVSEIPV